MEELNNILENNPDLRFFQALCILNIVRYKAGQLEIFDDFNRESSIIYKNLKNIKKD